MRSGDVRVASEAVERGLRMRVDELVSCGLSALEALELALLMEVDVQRAGRALRSTRSV
jgi:hypothetical protein